VEQGIERLQHKISSDTLLNSAVGLSLASVDEVWESDYGKVVYQADRFSVPLDCRNWVL